MTDQPTTWMRGLIAVGVATAVNAILFVAFRQFGVSLRTTRAMGSTDLADMVVGGVILLTVVPAFIAVLVAVLLKGRTTRARWIFNGLVVLVAFLSLFLLPPLDSETIDKVFQAVLHLVPAAALVALVGPTLKSE